MSKPDYDDCLGRLSLVSTEIPTIRALSEHSAQRIREARSALEALNLPKGLTILALGSIGRYEASDTSDLDLLVCFGGQLSNVDAKEHRQSIAEALRKIGFDVADKTFIEPCSVIDLTKNIGGPKESNIELTRRALLLTESACLHGDSTSDELRQGVLNSYADAFQTRGRHLTSLLNDLHRYYRTLCVDYHWKVTSEGKEWGLRNMKLRHSRKLWHLSNIVMQCAALDQSQSDGNSAESVHDGVISSLVGKPPLMKLVKAVDCLRDETLRSQSHLALSPIFKCYDRFLSLLSKRENRDGLEKVEYPRRDESSIYREFSESARDFQKAAHALFEVLYGRFNEHLVRYVVL